MIRNTLLIALISLQHVYAQNALVYSTLNDYINNNPKPFNLYISQRSMDDGEWAGATLYDLTGDERPQTIELKKECFAVAYHDSLFINLYGAMNVKAFAYVKEKFGTYLYFTSVASNLLEHRAYVLQQTGNHTTKYEMDRNRYDPTYIPLGKMNVNSHKAMKGTGPAASSKQFSYLYGTQEGQVFLLTPSMLEDMLSNRPELLRLYTSSGSQDNDGIYLWYLKRLFNKE